MLALGLACNELGGLDAVHRAPNAAGMANVSPETGGAAGARGEAAKGGDGSSLGAEPGGSGDAGGGGIEVSNGTDATGASGAGGKRPPSSGGSSGGAAADASTLGGSTSVRGGAGGTDAAGETGGTPESDDCNAAGDSVDEALDFGELGMLKSCPNDTYVDAGGDFYKFTVRENSQLTYTVTPEAGSIQTYLYRDATQINPANWLINTNTTSMPGRGDVNLERGVYYLKVVSPSKVLYGLEVGAERYALVEPSEEPGDDPDHFLDVGVVSTLQKFGGYVGKTDSDDYYRLELQDNTNLVFTLSAVEGQVLAELYPATSQPDLAHPLAQTAWVTNTDYHREVFAMGSYLLRVTASTATTGSFYTLALSADSSAL